METQAPVTIYQSFERKLKNEDLRTVYKGIQKLLIDPHIAGLPLGWCSTDI